ncbi:vesicle-associated membrane protein 5 [Mixophyes fleayi]|uniref:vesicle-associated membrane protein 5 n=1 Tax=Mixophyes fleayi TaxID=3061075 RepID=UPI003F4DB394
MASKNLEACQQNAEEVKVLMKENVEKVLEREGKLQNLEVRSDELKIMASSFEKTAKTVERKTRWEKWRWYIICAAIILVILIVLIIFLAVYFGGGQAVAAVTAPADP